MSNSFKVVDLVLKESQRIAHEKLSFIGSIDRQYDPDFKYQPNRGPNGQTIRIRAPNQYTRRQGSRVMDVQEQDEATQNFTVATQDGVDMRFNSAELMQSVNSTAAFDDLSKNYIEPAVAVLCAGIESDVIAYCTKATYNYVGNVGTAISTLEYPGKARAKLNQALAPKENRSIQVDSVTMASVVNGVAAYFNPTNALSEQYREGLIARTSMADWYEQEKLWTLSNISDISATLDTYTILNGDADLTVNSFATPNVGMLFTIAGIYDVNPETKAAYPHLKIFTLLTGSTSTNLLISPTIYITGPKKNVAAATGADITPSGLTTAVLTFIGSGSASYVQSLMYQKEAYQFATVDLPIMDDAHKCVRSVKEGISMRVWMASDIRNDELLMRLDVLWGVAALRPAWGCRLFGAANV